MLLKKNINLGRVNINLIFFIIILSSFFSLNLNSADNLEGKNTHIKVLDKISSKNILVKLKNGDDIMIHCIRPNIYPKCCTKIIII